MGADMAQASLEKSPWQAGGSDKRELVRRMFADIAERYDFMNGLMTLSLHKRWRTYAVSLLNLEPGHWALDVCCGTGDFMVPLRRAVGPSGKVVGVDYCPPMIALAKNKLGARGLALGDACALPFSDACFDGATVGWGLRNLCELDAGLCEITRVLKPGGRFVSLDMAVPRHPILRGASRLVGHTLLPFVGGLIGKRQAYTYLPKSTETFASREELAAAFERAGLRDVGWRDLMFGNICLHWGRKP